MTTNGLAIAGICGMTASAAVGGLHLMAAGLVPESYAATSTPLFAGSDLPNADSWVIGGWDLPGKTLPGAINTYDWFPDHRQKLLNYASEIVLWPAVWSNLDFAAIETGQDGRPGLGAGAELVATQLRDFKTSYELDTVTVGYLGSPHLSWRGTEIDLRGGGEDLAVPGVLMYAVGAALAGAHFVDFTPSSALDTPGLIEIFHSNHARLAGRDLSTGQTMLKAAVSEMLDQRGLHPDSWYSTNLIGNHDGMVLSDSRFNELKINDKKSVLDKTVDHEVRIEFMRAWGDNKESWDAMTSSTWLQSGQVELRLNWRGPDSFLAAPMILDVVRLLNAPVSARSWGLQAELGYFFKRPIGAEGTTLGQRWTSLISRYAAISAEGSA